MANNIDVKDAAAATKTLKTTDNAGVHTPHHNVDAVIAGTGATNLGKAEDAAHSSGDTGVFVLAVRKDTAAALAGTDGDYIPFIVDANGRLHVVVPATTNGGATAKTSDYDSGAGTDTVTMFGLALPASGGAVAAPGDTSNGLDVDPTRLPAGEIHLGEVGGNLTMISTEFTRPADTTAYAANDSVSDSTSSTTMQALANAARVSGGSGYITGIRITTDKKSITPRFRVHFFNTNGATVTNDNAAFKTAYADISKYVGYWDMPAMITGADTTNSTDSRSVDLTMRIPYTCAATTLYFLLETLDAFTPASGEKFTVTVFLDRN